MYYRPGAFSGLAHSKPFANCTPSSAGDSSIACFNDSSAGWALRFMYHQPPTTRGAATVPVNKDKPSAPAVTALLKAGLRAEPLSLRMCFAPNHNKQHTKKIVTGRTTK